MIIFESIRWKNMLSTGNEWTTVFLNRSKSTLIAGLNGSGKSTFIDALTFALYGKPYRNINKPQLINSITGKNLVTEVNFSIGSKKYQIRRGIKPAIFEIYCDGVLLPQNADAREYQDSLEKNIIRMNFKTFCQVVVLGTANFTPFMQLPAQHRREIIEDLLDIQIFSKMLTLLKDKVNQNKSDLSQNEYDIKLLDEKIKMHKKNLASIKQNNEEIIKAKIRKVDELLDEVETLDADMQSASSHIKELKELIADHDALEENLQKFKMAQRDLSQKKIDHENHIHFFSENNKCPTCTQIIDETFKEGFISKRKERISNIDTALEDIDLETSRLSQKIDENKAVISKINQISRDIDSIHIKKTAIMQSIRTYRKEIEELQEKTKESNVDSNDLISLYDERKIIENTREKLIKDRHTYDMALVMLKDGGIKTKIIKQYVPVINKLVNKYLAAMDFFINFELNEKFEEVIRSRFRDEFSYSNFSEGEKMRINLAILFTWRAIAKLRNSAATNLLIMDEVFDSSLDNAGTDDFLKIIETLPSDTNVFVISHKAADTLYDKFHSSIQFVKTKNFSKMV